MSIVQRTNLQPIIRALKTVIEQTDELEGNVSAGIRTEDISGLLGEITSINTKLNPVLSALVPNPQLSKTILTTPPVFGGGLTANTLLISEPSILKLFDCDILLSSADTVSPIDYMRTDFYDSSNAVPDPSDTIVFSLIHSIEGVSQTGFSTRVKMNNHSLDFGSGLVLNKGLTCVYTKTASQITVNTIATNLLWEAGIPEYNYTGITQSIADLYEIVGVYEA